MTWNVPLKIGRKVHNVEVAPGAVFKYGSTWFEVQPSREDNPTTVRLWALKNGERQLRLQTNMPIEKVARAIHSAKSKKVGRLRAIKKAVK